MIPLNDTEPNRYPGVPMMVSFLIFLNVLIFLVTMRLEEMTRMGVYTLFGTMPYLTFTRQGGGALSSITSMFLHGGIFHLVGNMLALWVFGRRVENACGGWRFLTFYLTCGITADFISTIFHLLAQVDIRIPSIGASGAVFGVMGAYLLLFYHGRIRVLIIWFIPLFPKIRAFWVILYFLVLQLAPAFSMLLYGEEMRVGYWAHLGGFGGAILIFFYLRPEAFERYQNNEPV